MSANIVRTYSPEERELKKKNGELAKLEGDLADRELHFATLQNELRAFRVRYLRAVGTLYSELDDLKARIAEAQARRYPQDKKRREQAAEARATAAESAGAAAAAQDSRQPITFEPGDNLKKLYRELARRIHPDLSTDPSKRAHRNRLMAEANRAYAEGSEPKLRAIVDEWDSSPESVEGEGIAAELVRTIRKIHQVERRLAAIGVEHSELRRSELYRLMESVDLAEAGGQDLLAQMAEQLTRQIADARTRLDELNCEHAYGR
jgi:hypothetical protein